MQRRDNSQQGYYGAPPDPNQTSRDSQQGYIGRPTNPSNLPIFNPADQSDYLPNNPPFGNPYNPPFRNSYDRTLRNTLPMNPPTSRPPTYGQDRFALPTSTPSQLPYLVQPEYSLPSHPPPPNNLRQAYAPHTKRPNATTSGYAHSPYPTTREPSHCRPIRTTDSQPRNANSVQAPITLSSFIPNGYRAPMYHNDTAQEVAMTLADKGPEAAVSNRPDLSPEEAEQTLKLNLALINIARSVAIDGEYGVPETMQLLLEGKPSLLSHNQLESAERFMNRYATYKAGGKDTPWSQQLMRDLTRVTRGYGAGRRHNAKILNGASKAWKVHKSALVVGGGGITIDPSHPGCQLGPRQQGTNATSRRTPDAYQQKASQTSSRYDERSGTMEDSHRDLMSRIDKPYDAGLMQNLYDGDLTTAHGEDAKRTFRAYTQNTKQRADWIKLMTKVGDRENGRTLITELERRLAEIQPPSQDAESTPKSLPSYGYPAGPSYGGQPYGGY